MEIYNEKSLMEKASNSEPDIIPDIDNKKNKTDQPEKKTKELENARQKLGRICYAINAYKDIDENLIGRYGLNDIVEKCHFLEKLINNDSSAFIEKNEDLQHYIGNFEGTLNILAHIGSSNKKEQLMGASFQKKVSEFDQYLTSQIQQGHSKETTLH